MIYSIGQNLVSFNSPHARNCRLVITYELLLQLGCCVTLIIPSLGSKVNVVAAVDPFTGVADVHIPLTVPFVLPEDAQLSTSPSGTLLNVNEGPVTKTKTTTETDDKEPRNKTYCRD